MLKLTGLSAGSCCSWEHCVPAVGFRALTSNSAFWLLTEVLVVVSCSWSPNSSMSSCTLCVCVYAFYMLSRTSWWFCINSMCFKVTKPSPSPSLFACTDPLPAPLCSLSVSASALSVLWVRCSAHDTPTWETQEVWPPFSSPSGQGIFPLHRVSPSVANQTGDVWRDGVADERGAWREASVAAGSAEGMRDQRWSVRRQLHEPECSWFDEASNQELLSGNHVRWFCPSHPAAAVLVQWQPGIL